MVYAPPRKPRPKPKPGRPAPRRAPQPTRRRALELLASCGVEGCTEAVMLANGVTVEQMVELVREGLATAVPGRIKAGGQTLEVTRLRITEVAGARGDEVMSGQRRVAWATYG